MYRTCAINDDIYCDRCAETNPSDATFHTKRRQTYMYCALITCNQAWIKDTTMAETLTCERCGGDNPADARFCIDCGAALVNATTGPTTRLTGIDCPACQTHN